MVNINKTVVFPSESVFLPQKRISTHLNRNPKVTLPDPACIALPVSFLLQIEKRALENQLLRCNKGVIVLYIATNMKKTIVISIGICVFAVR